MRIEVILRRARWWRMDSGIHRNAGRAGDRNL
jgi:hypothetical protein